MRIARVFPRRTNATPTDELAFTEPPGLFPPDVDAVDVSVTFSWDVERGWWLARQWEDVGLVTVGGPAIGTHGEEFEPGMYLKPGYVITSRGCPNRCWFCDAWKRDGTVRELPIKDGWNVLDDNLLACSEGHVRSVFEMLHRQPERIEFTGGLDASLLKDWHVDLLWNLKPKQMFFAYDSDNDLDPLIEAGKKLLTAGWTVASHRLRCYVLIGDPGDTIESAERRLHRSIAAGFLPMAMLWRNPKNPHGSREWRRFQRAWARPAMTAQAELPA